MSTDNDENERDERDDEHSGELTPEEIARRIELERARYLAAADQGSAMLADTLPPFCMRLFEGFLAAGFNEIQALDLVKTCIFSTVGNGPKRP